MAEQGKWGGEKGTERSNIQVWSLGAHVVGIQALTFATNSGVQELETEPGAWLRRQVVCWHVISTHSEVREWRCRMGKTYEACWHGNHIRLGENRSGRAEEGEGKGEGEGLHCRRRPRRRYGRASEWEKKVRYVSVRFQRERMENE